MKTGINKAEKATDTLTRSLVKAVDRYLGTKLGNCTGCNRKADPGK